MANNINKEDLVQRISKKTNLTKGNSLLILDAVLEEIQQAVQSGKEVKLVGFGTFTQIRKKARRGRNPKTGEEVMIPESKVPRFRPGKEFKTLLNN